MLCQIGFVCSFCSLFKSVYSAYLVQPLWSYDSRFIVKVSRPTACLHIHDTHNTHKIHTQDMFTVYMNVCDCSREAELID